MAKKKPKFNQEMAIRGANRRLFARSPLVFEKLNESRQEFARYKKDGSRAKKNWVKRQCEVCNKWVGSSHIAIDHIDPVVPPAGFPAHYDIWDRTNVFLRRLWCDTSGKANLQRICDTCHDKKTQEERITRLFTKYHGELDQIESQINSMSGSTCVSDILAKQYIKQWKKELSKYTAKKKTQGLESVVQRARQLKERITH
jgi:hypothetical protein